MSSDLYAPPQYVDLAHAAWWAQEAILTPLRGRSMQDPANELRRIPLPRRWVNRRRCARRGPGCTEDPRPSSSSALGENCFLERLQRHKACFFLLRSHWGGRRKGRGVVPRPFPLSSTSAVGGDVILL